MHDTAYEIGRAFLERYHLGGHCQVVEIGSMNVNGSLRCHSAPEFVYLGLDIAHGQDVDVIIDPLKPLPLRSGFADLVVSSSQMEHDTFFWNTFLEMLRVAKDDGYVYVNVPSNGYYHRHPLDCWRLYPDAGIALTRWARHNGCKCTLIESFTAHRKADVWNDFVAIFQKADETQARAPGFLSDAFPAANVHRLGSAGVSNEHGWTEDMQLRQTAEQSGRELEHLRSAYRSVEAELVQTRVREALLTEEVTRLTATNSALRRQETSTLVGSSAESKPAEL